MSHPLKSIRETAEATGLTLRALRFYENKHLIKPHRERKHRLYSAADIERLRKIKRLKACGVRLGDMPVCLDGTAAERAAILAATEAAQSELIATLHKQAAALAALRAAEEVAS